MDEYEGQTDEQVLAQAQDAYRQAEALPPRTRARNGQWEIFDRAMSELMLRAMSHVLWKIHERGTAIARAAEVADREDDEP